MSCVQTSAWLLIIHPHTCQSGLRCRPGRQSLENSADRMVIKEVRPHPALYDIQIQADHYAITAASPYPMTSGTLSTASITTKMGH
jgi:hypothetical protein